MRVLERRAFDFSSVPAKTTIGPWPLAERVPVGHAGSIVASLRLHAAVFPTGAVARLDVIAVAPTCEDPAQDFTGPVVAAFEILSTAPVPGLQVSPLGDRFGSHVSLLLTVTQSGDGGTFRFTVSFDLRVLEHAGAWSPLALGSKLKCWLDERDQVLVSGAVSTWGDQSPGGTVDFAQTPAGNRPSGAGRVNGLAAPDFDGTDDSMVCTVQTSALWASSGGHLLAVVDTTGATLIADQANVWQEGVILSSNGAGWFGLGWSDGGPRGYAYDGSFNATPRVTGILSGAHLFDFWLANGTLSLRIDGGAAVTVGGIGTLTSDESSVNIGYAYGTSLWLGGRIASMIICNAALSSEEQEAARLYLSSKYGVPA